MPVAVSVLIVLALFLVLAALVAHWVLPAAVARALNRVVTRPPYQVPANVQRFHNGLLVADLHADALLWNRNLLAHSSYGHVDLPRLVAGNVALQVFAAVTRVPLGLNFERNDARSADLITLLAVAQAWPPRTWRSLLKRALYLADRLDHFAAASNGCLQIIKRASDLDALVDRRGKEPGVVGALLALEGVHALEGNLENLDVLYDAGYRMVGLHHFFDNDAGGSAHGTQRGGLSAFGRELVARVQVRPMILDLAHSSPAVVADVLRIASAPVIVSHTGLCGTADNQRNLSDDQVRGIASTGGLMGIALFRHAVGGSSVADTARAIRYGARLVGAEHLALGSDFDGAIATSIDAGGLALLTAALQGEGLTGEEIAGVMGGNAFRLFRRLLPPD